jgi:hypothetical protein
MTLYEHRHSHYFALSTVSVVKSLSQSRFGFAFWTNVQLRKFHAAGQIERDGFAGRDLKAVRNQPCVVSECGYREQKRKKPKCRELHRFQFIFHRGRLRIIYREPGEQIIKMGGMTVWTVVGVLLIVLLIIVIAKLLRK